LTVLHAASSMATPQPADSLKAKLGLITVVSIRASKIAL
jgi:hypothetical protein